MPDGEGRPAATALDTLTFMFADLRDYTAFVERYGDAAAAALIADYRRLVRAEVSRAGGGEIKTEGDSFYVVFSSAQLAIQCAVAILREAERATLAHPERPLRIGVGVHAGEPVPQEGQFVGSAVNVAARLADRASAGEILVSDVVRGLVRTSLALPMREREGVALKGVTDPPRVYHVGWRESAAPKETSARPSAPREQIAEETPVDRRILCPILIGRDGELRALESLRAQAMKGSGRTALVAGEAGLGKSALLRAFLERARDAGARVLVGECTEVEARRPFGPFVEILRSAFRELEATSVEDSLRAHAAELLSLFPERARADVDAEAMEEAERYRIHAAFARLFSDLARAHALVLTIEDLHWADEATLELFPYLARKLRDAPVLLVGTYRSDELHRLHPLRRVLAELARGRLVEEVTLHRLTLEEVGSVLRATMHLNREPTTAWRQAIYERCEGNPFFIEEVLKALVERGDLAYRDGMWLPTKDVTDIVIPDSVRDAVLERFRSLSEDSRQALQIAAVIGQRFDFELLRRVSGLAEAALLKQVRTAIDAQLVVEEVGDDGEERYAFRHALTRESVLAELLLRERRMLHRAVGEALEATAPDASRRAEELAYHFDEARDVERALRYHDLAAREAHRVFAFARERQHLERALELAPDDHPGLGDMQLRLAEASYSSSDYPRALRAGTEAHRRFTAAGEVPRAVRALTRLARYHWMGGDSARAEEFAAEAVRIAEPLGPSAELAMAFGSRSALAMLDGRHAESESWGERAISMARQIGDEAIEADALASVGLAVSHEGRHEEAVEMLRTALRIAQERQLVETAERATYNLSVALIWADALDEARRVSAEGLRFAQARGALSDATLQREAYLAWLDGDWDRVADAVRQVSGESVFSGLAYGTGAIVSVARDGPHKGLPLIDDAKRLLRGASENHRQGLNGQLTVAYLLAEDAANALERARAVVAKPVPVGRRAQLSGAVVCGIVAARLLPDDPAFGMFARLVEDWPEPRGKRLSALRLFVEAERLVDRRDPAAIGRCARSVDALADIGLHPLAMLVRRRCAEVALGLDPTHGLETAASQLAAAMPFLRKAKATWYLGRLREWAAERGIAFPDA